MRQSMRILAITLLAAATSAFQLGAPRPRAVARPSRSGRVVCDDTSVEEEAQQGIIIFSERALKQVTAREYFFSGR